MSLLIPIALCALAALCHGQLSLEVEGSQAMLYSGPQRSLVARTLDWQVRMGLSFGEFVWQNRSQFSNDPRSQVHANGQWYSTGASASNILRLTSTINTTGMWWLFDPFDSTGSQSQAELKQNCHHKNNKIIDNNRLQSNCFTHSFVVSLSFHSSFLIFSLCSPFSSLDLLRPR